MRQVRIWGIINTHTIRNEDLIRCWTWRRIFVSDWILSEDA